MQYVYCKLAVREVAILESFQDLNFRWTLTTQNRPYFVISPKLQLNKYETAPNFIQLIQNLTWDCLLISVYLPVFTSFCMMCS